MKTRKIISLSIIWLMLTGSLATTFANWYNNDYYYRNWVRYNRNNHVNHTHPINHPVTYVRPVYYTPTVVVQPRIIPQYVIIPQYTPLIEPVYIPNVSGLIQRSISYLSNWVQETLTTWDSNELTKLFNEYNDFQSTVQTSAYPVNWGAVFTLTSNNSNTIYELQSNSSQIFWNNVVWNLGYNSSMTINRSNISNGVQITVTSYDYNTISSIQNELNRINQENIVQKNITEQSNGIVITLTSSDSSTVSKLQSDMSNLPQYFQ